MRSRLGLLGIVLLGLAAVLGSLPSPPVRPVRSGPQISYTYLVRGLNNTSNLESFAAQAAATYADGRGWNLGGSIAFRRVGSGGDYTLWLAAAGNVAGFGSPCDSSYSCTVGSQRHHQRVTLVDRARPSWNGAGGSLADYRHMVVNHETGHWLGFAHEFCGWTRTAGAGDAAAVDLDAGLPAERVADRGASASGWRHRAMSRS